MDVAISAARAVLTVFISNICTRLLSRRMSSSAIKISILLPPFEVFPRKLYHLIATISSFYCKIDIKNMISHSSKEGLKVKKAERLFSRLKGVK